MHHLLSHRDIRVSIWSFVRKLSHAKFAILIQQILFFSSILNIWHINTLLIARQKCAVLVCKISLVIRIPMLGYGCHTKPFFCHLYVLHPTEFIRQCLPRPSNVSNHFFRIQSYRIILGTTKVGFFYSEIVVLQPSF